METKNKDKIIDEALDINSIKRKDVIMSAYEEIQKTNSKDIISYGYGWLDEKLSGIFPGQLILVGGESGCLHKDTPIYDPIQKTTLTVFERYKEGKSFNVYSLDKSGRVIITKANPPKRFFSANMYKLSNGKNEIIVTGKHRIWNGDSFVSVEQIKESSFVLLPTISEYDLSNYFSNDPRYYQIILDFRFYCRSLFHFYDQLLQKVLNIFQFFSPLKVYVPGRNYFYCEMDDLDYKLKHIHLYRLLHRLSKKDSAYRLNKIYRDEYQSHSVKDIFSRFSLLLPLWNKSYFYFFRICKVLYIGLFVFVSKVLNKFLDFVDLPYKFKKELYFKYSKWGVKAQEDDIYYDFTVPKYGNYYACGLFHHNTGKTLFTSSVVYKCPKPSAIFSLEERLEDFGKKALYFEIGKIRKQEGKKQYPWRAFVRGELNQNKDFDLDVAKAYENLKTTYPYFQQMDKMATIDVIEQRIEMLAWQGIKLFLIDHLHSFDLMADRISKADYIEYIMTRLRIIAIKCKISIIIVAHYRKLNGNKPTIDSFKDSISIVQNASVVINIWRNRDEGITEDEKNKTEFIIPKSRDLGGEGKIEVVFNPNTGEYQKYGDWILGVPSNINKSYEL